MKGTIRRLIAFSMLAVAGAAASAQPADSHERMFEWTFESRKTYADPFNDVDVDVVFTRDGQSWRVPAFWRGGQEWSVRFAPPSAGEYRYRLESTDAENPDLNGRDGRVTVTAYAGENALLRSGPFRVSGDGRHFEHADGTPFYWLGDTWWTGMSDRLSWEGFQRLTADRKKKGFTVVQIIAGLVPPEELAPIDPGFRNEGGAVWEPGFERINPRFFDYADRRVKHLIDSEIAPVIVGGWNPIIDDMGIDKLKKHWRYVIARYGAYPVFWIAGGEVYDPPEGVADRVPHHPFPGLMRGWTEVLRYIRSIDPYDHPLSVHEAPPPWDFPLQDESVTDFDMLHPSHFGWHSIGTEVTQLNLHYARTRVTKPIVVGEVGYETLGGQHLHNFQRVAFWLGMLNGAAGHTYGANAVWEAYTADKPFHRKRWSFMTWEEGMNLPGSTHVGLGARLLRRYPWHRFAPHPEWITPRGTTFLEPNDKINGYDIDLILALARGTVNGVPPLESEVPDGVWKERQGTFRQPYAAGIPGEVRFVYMPYFGLSPPPPPTILGLEPGVRYQAYFWEPTLGIEFDLGTVEASVPGGPIAADAFDGKSTLEWSGCAEKLSKGELSVAPESLCLANGVELTNVVAAVDAKSGADAALILRYRDSDNYLAARYSTRDMSIYLIERRNGRDSAPLGRVSVPGLGPDIRLTAEVRDDAGAVSVTDGSHKQTTAIVRLRQTGSGGAGLASGDGSQTFDDFDLRESVAATRNDPQERKLYDALGGYRGEMRGDGLPEMDVVGGARRFDWENYGKNKTVLLDAYLPAVLPGSGDWLLVLDAKQ